MLTRLQPIWDYVPAGELLTTLGASLVPFAIADVLFAPFAEESIYRGYGLTRLLGRFSQPVVIMLSCLFFGILHWTGGFWFIRTAFAVLFYYSRECSAIQTGHR